MSIASIGVLISCLLLTGCASLVSINLTSMMSSIEDNNSITVYLTNGLPSLSAVQVGDQIRSIENVSECTFVPKDDGLADMMDLLGENAVVLEGLDGDENPLPDAYQISMHDLSNMTKLYSRYRPLRAWITTPITATLPQSFRTSI